MSDQAGEAVKENAEEQKADDRETEEEVRESTGTDKD